MRRVVDNLAMEDKKLEVWESIAAGIIQYQLGAVPVTGCGFSYSAAELNAALSGPVAEVVFDDSGKADIEALLAGLAETDFEKGGIERILSDNKPPEDWRVGEALAESYLIHQKDCFFPWPTGRDERKSGSSLPGADLVGFQSNGTDDFFCIRRSKDIDRKQISTRSDAWPYRLEAAA